MRAALALAVVTAPSKSTVMTPSSRASSRASWPRCALSSSSRRSLTPSPCAPAREPGPASVAAWRERSSGGGTPSPLSPESASRCHARRSRASTSWASDTLSTAQTSAPAARAASARRSDATATWATTCTDGRRSLSLAMSSRAWPRPRSTTTMSGPAASTRPRASVASKATSISSIEAKPANRAARRVPAPCPPTTTTRIRLRGKACSRPIPGAIRSTPVTPSEPIAPPG